MLRYFFDQQNINTEQFFFDIQYSTGHDQTANGVKGGKVDILVIDPDARVIVSSGHSVDSVMAD
jgi:ABC-type phosphate/phosphonate transport system substrate-binding protein